ncbi:MAG TPA: peptidylprolyl isomerase [Polyangia bacterium]|jgi:FKBP-type peptidyl-prolyl cis-trans isomerase SlyD
MDENTKIGPDRVVSLAYTVKDDEGEVLDESDAAEPLVYLHGHDQVFPALEAALLDHGVGDSEKITVAAGEGYGDRDPEKVLTVPRDRFDFEPEPGQVLEAHLADGHTMAFQVMEVAADGVTLDGNHPLAGKRLHFEVKVVDVRQATDEELEHGHAHGAHSHHEHDHD